MAAKKLKPITIKKLPQISSLSKADIKEFEKILGSRDKALLRHIEAEVVDLVNTKRAPTECRSEVYAEDRNDLDIIVAHIDKAVRRFNDLPHTLRGKVVLKYSLKVNDPGTGLPDFQAFNKAVKEVKKDTKFQRGVKENEDTHCFAGSLAFHLRVGSSYRLPKTEDGVLGLCIRQALTIADGEPHRESVKVYVERAIDMLIEAGIDVLNPPVTFDP